MKIQDVLARKGVDVVTVSSAQSVIGAMRTLVAHNIGSVVVVDRDEIVGILTERDILRLAAAEPRQLERLHVGEVMTMELVVGVPEDDLNYVAAIMTKNRIRHLPVVRDGELVGILSIGDVVNAIRGEMEVENRYLRSYIQGAAS